MIFLITSGASATSQVFLRWQQFLEYSKEMLRDAVLTFLNVTLVSGSQ